jgi:serine/threonine protein kinase
MRKYMTAQNWRLDVGIRLLGQVAAGMCHVHASKVVHGDLKLKNILIDAAGMSWMRRLFTACFDSWVC